MKYRLTERIGSGGMAEVFRATGEGPDGFERAFVIKRIHPHLSHTPEFVRMFVDEAKISARIVHPNVVQVFEFAFHDDSHFIVMEPVDGVDMARLLGRLEQRGEVAPATFVAELGRQVCRGLDFAHTLTDVAGQPLGIVHRDVTPPNIMAGWNGTVKILDFGLARAAQELRTNLTDAGTLKGKMSYVAPEQLDGQPADARSDVFSLGVVLHELLSGQRLFAGENDLETLRMVREMPVPRPSLRNPDVKPALETAVMRALARDPNQRFRGAAEMADALDAVVLRKRYSTQAFARDARALFPASEAVGEALVEELRIGAGGSSVVAGEATARPSTQPPPLPRAAAIRARTPARVPWLAAVVSSAALAAFALLVLLRHAPTPASATPTAPLSPFIELTLDSTPQGAVVTADAIASGAPAGRLGETPLVARLPRGETAVALTLTKEGFAPLPFKVVPNHDKDLVAPLERAPAAAMVATEARPRQHVGATGVRRSSSLASQGAPGARPPAPPARAPTTAGAPETTATVHFRDDAGDGFQLIEARFVMDDHPLPVLTAAPRAADLVIYTGRVRPGRHVVSARLVYQGRNRGPFTYLAGYKVNVQSREVVEVPADRAASFTIATEKKKGMNIPLDKQLAVTVRDDARRAMR
jgi:tRNA A-37 threonylcarbamoyl transferase component Bud32